MPGFPDRATRVRYASSISKLVRKRILRFFASTVGRAGAFFSTAAHHSGVGGVISDLAAPKTRSPTCSKHQALTCLMFASASLHRMHAGDKRSLSPVSQALRPEGTATGRALV